MRALNGHRQPIRALAFSPDGKYIVGCAADNSTIVWNTETGGIVRTFSGKSDGGACQAVCFSRDGRDMASIEDDDLHVRSTPTGELKRTLTGPVFCAAFSPDGERLITGGSKPSEGDSKKATPSEPSPIFTSTGDEDAVIWDVASGDRILTLTAHENAVVGVAFNANGNRVVTGSHDHSAIIWDAVTGEVLHVLRGHKAIINCVAFSPTEEKVLTASWDGAIILWDARTGREINRLAGHTASVNSVMFNNDGSLAISCADDGTVLVWNIATGRELGRLLSIDAGKDWLIVTPDGVFDGSENARKKYVRFRDPKDPMKVVPPEQGFADYYHPNLLADILAGHAVAPPGWQHITIRFVPADPTPAGGKPAAPANPPSPPPSAAPHPIRQMTGLRPNSSWADFKASSDFNPVLATDVYSPNGTVASVKFYAGTGTTDLLGTATYADDNGNWTIDVSPSNLGGATTVTIVVTDSEGLANGSSGTTFSISPVSLGQITVDTGDGSGPTTTPVYTSGTSVSISVASVLTTNSGASIAGVKFYLDTSGTGIYNPSTVQLLTGSLASNGSGGYTLSGVNTNGWIGDQTIFAVAYDSTGGRESSYPVRANPGRRSPGVQVAAAPTRDVQSRHVDTLCQAASAALPEPR